MPSPVGEYQSPEGPLGGGEGVTEPRLRARLICDCPIAEASQQMAELSEVLVLRLEGYERQQKEITQLQAEITKLQQRCQSVSCSARPKALPCVGIRVGRDNRRAIHSTQPCP